MAAPGGPLRLHVYSHHLIPDRVDRFQPSPDPTSAGLVHPTARSVSDGLRLPIPRPAPVTVTETPSTLAHNCFVCGPANPIGLRLEFRVEDGLCLSEFTPGENHEGYPGVVHGGILFSVLDDVMANWLYLQGARAYTARCDIRFRKSGEVGERLILEGRHLETRGKVVKMKGTAVQESSGELVAESTGTFMIINPDEFKAALKRSGREAFASEHGSPSEQARS